MKLERLLLVCFLTALVWMVSGCGDNNSASSADSPSPEAVTHVYESEDGQEFVARIEQDSAWLFLPEGTVQLSHVPAASGAKYSAKDVTLWTKGQEATLMREGQPDLTLQNNRQRAGWEHARLNGVDFRAVGNEPGWALEIGPDQQATFISAYGEDRFSFPPPEPPVDQDKHQTTYFWRAEGHQLQAIITASPCQDTMDGRVFPNSVIVTLDGQVMQGCGRPLH